MRIGFDAKRYFLNRTGLGNYSRDLIRILEEHYPENEYIRYSPKRSVNWSDSTDFSAHNKLPQSKLGQIFPGLWRRQWMVSDLKKDKIALYHGLSGEIPIGLREAQIKSVVTIHDLIFLKYPELYKPIDRMLYKKKFGYALKHADKIVAISQQTKNDISEFYAIPKESIDVIYQGCHPAFKTVKSESEKETLRQKYNLPQHFLLNVGSIEPRKNAFQIVKAVENMDIPLLIIGKDTRYAQEIKKYIVKKGLDNRIFIRQGFTMEELAIIYAMAGAFIYPSKYEGFGIPIIEALYSGIPVITTNTGVFPEAGGPFSYYIDPDNVEELSYAITSVLSSSTLREEMRTQGMQFVQQFNDEVLARKWNDLYLNL